MMRVALMLLCLGLGSAAEAATYYSMSFDTPRQTLTFTDTLNWKDTALGSAGYPIDDDQPVLIDNRVMFKISRDSRVRFSSSNPGSSDRGILDGSFFVQWDQSEPVELFSTSNKPNDATVYANLPAGEHVARFYGTLKPGVNGFWSTYVYNVGVTPVPLPFTMLSVALAGGYFLARRRRAQPPAGQNGTPGSAATGNSTSG